MASTLERLFPANHPAAEGHFPGNPIIPGAVLLSETLHAIEENLGIHLWPCEIKSAKFFHPVRPGDKVGIAFSRSPGDIKFICTVAEKTVLSGQIKCEGG